MGQGGSAAHEKGIQSETTLLADYQQIKQRLIANA
jgi:hypothetical protein